MKKYADCCGRNATMTPKNLRLENNDRSAFMELRNKNVNDPLETFTYPAVFVIKPLCSTAIKSSLTLQSAVAKALPETKFQRPSPPKKINLKRIRSIIHMDLVACKDESINTPITKAELNNINILLQSSCREPPKFS